MNFCFGEGGDVRSAPCYLCYRAFLYFLSPLPFFFSFFSAFLLFMRQLEVSGSSLVMWLCLSKGGVPTVVEVLIVYDDVLL